MNNQDLGIFASIRAIFGSMASIAVNSAGTVDTFVGAAGHIGEVAVITAKSYEREALRNGEYEAAVADLKYDAKLTKLRSKYAKAGKSFSTKAELKASKKAKRQAAIDEQVAAAVQAAVDEAKASKAK